MSEAARVILAQRAAQAAMRRDMLGTFGWPSPKHAKWAGFIGQRIESSLRAANQGAKTFSGGAVAVAVAQGRSHLDGVLLPNVPVPNHGGVLVPSHKQQVASSQQAMEHWLGEWPHDIAWLSEKEHKASVIHVATPRCKHGTREHCATCSSITFYSQESPESVLGQRKDWYWSDEPYSPAMWREIRKNCIYRWITWTPLEQHIWEPVERDFAGRMDVPVRGRVQVGATLYDNRFLSDERKRELVESYEGDVFKNARITGKPMDAEGATPWGDLGFARLQAMLAECCEPSLYEFPLAAAHRSAEKAGVLHVSFEPEADECYYLGVDGSMGVSDEDGFDESDTVKKGRDPSAIHVYARRRPRLAAVYEGYLVPQVVGRLGAAIAAMYGDVEADVEDQGGFGEAVMIGFRDAGWKRFAPQDKRLARGGGHERRYGFKTDAVTRGLYIGAVQDQILHGGIEVRNRRVIESALGMRVDKNGKLLARRGLHDEHVILWGRAAHWMGMAVNAPRARRVDEALPPTAAQVYMAELRRARGEDQDRFARRGEAWSGTDDETWR